jgi:hypothetical protein
MNGYDQAYALLKANGMSVDTRGTGFTLICGQWGKSFDTHHEAVNAGLARLGAQMVFPLAFYNR